MSKAAELAALIGSQTALSNRNLIINGAMQIDQRNQTTTATSYSIDRWIIVKTNFDELVIAVTQDTDNPSGNGFSNSLKVAVTTAESAQAADENMCLMQRIEGQNLQQLAYGTSSAKSLTLSFWVKSPVAGKHSLLFYQSTPNRSNLQSYTVSSANTWEYKTITVEGDTSGNIANDNTNELEVFWNLSSGTDFTGTPHTGWGAYSGTDDFAHSDSVNIAAQTGNFFLTGVQLEVGEQATPFEHRSFGDEYQRCLRYYYKTPAPNGGMSANETFPCIGNMDGSTTGAYMLQFPVTMRAAPSAFEQSGTASDYSIRVTSDANGTSVPTAGGFTAENAIINLVSSGAGFTSGDACFMRAESTDAFLAFSAEL